MRSSSCAFFVSNSCDVSTPRSCRSASWRSCSGTSGAATPCSVVGTVSADCLIAAEFTNLGLVFSGAAFLRDTRIYDPIGAPANHAVQKTSGTMTMSFPGLPRTVQYQSTQNNSCNVPVQAHDAAGNTLDNSVSNSSTYVSSGDVTFRRETIGISSQSGVATVSLSDDICAVLVDNLQIQ